ncbi:MAG: hypothetical protein P4L82_10900 [Ancalomicrobiaceae bacterium]|nr:hypothetical protein [Ancalomicrobiaceae bacterium]
MKTLSVLLLATSLSTLATAAFAGSSMPSDDVDRQIRIGNWTASNDNPSPSQEYSRAPVVVEGRQAAPATVIEGRQAARVYVERPTTDAEQYLIDHNVESNGN